MGKHSVPRGEKSTYGQANGAPRNGGYEGRHRLENSAATTPMDLPPRGQGVTHDDWNTKK